MFFNFILFFAADLFIIGQKGLEGLEGQQIKPAASEQDVQPGVKIQGAKLMLI